MKRKKTPVALITFLVVTFLGLIIMSPKFGFYSKSGEEQFNEMKEQMMKEAQAKSNSKQEKPMDINANAEAKAMQERMKKIGAQPQRPGTDADGEMRIPDQPSVLVPENKVYKPVPNEASTSSQWYK
jgi:hypothetical protein